MWLIIKLLLQLKSRRYRSKVAKIQPLYDGLNNSLLQFGVFDHKLSIDESMVHIMDSTVPKCLSEGNLSVSDIKYGCYAPLMVICTRQSSIVASLTGQIM